MYGLLILLAPLIGLSWIIHKVIPKAPSPLAVTAILVLLGILSADGLPAYVFDIKTTAELKDKNEFRVVSSKKYRSLWAPITYLWAPRQAIALVRPRGPNSGYWYKYDAEENAFVQVVLQMNKDPLAVTIYADCKSRRMELAVPDDKGILRVLPWMPMEPESYETYCTIDYTDQFKVVREKKIMD